MGGQALHIQVARVPRIIHTILGDTRAHRGRRIVVGGKHRGGRKTANISCSKCLNPALLRILHVCAQD